MSSSSPSRTGGARARPRPREATSLERRPSRSPAKMMCTTCFGSAAARARSNRRSRPAPRAAARPLVESPISSASSRCSACDEALPYFDAAARQQPVLACPASRAGRAGCGPATAGSPRRGSAARASSSARDEPKPRSPRSLSGSSSTSTSSTCGDRRARRAARSASPARRRTPRAVGVQQDDAHLAAVAGVDQAGSVDDRDAVAWRRGPSAAGRSPRSPRGSRRRARSPRPRARPGASATRSQEARSRPASPS